MTEMTFGFIEVRSLWITCGSLTLPGGRTLSRSLHIEISRFSISSEANIQLVVRKPHHAPLVYCICPSSQIPG